jgi:ribulose-phosphate 3-epimerase
MPNFILAPSMIAADLGRLEDQASQALAAGAECLHVDVMDGRFVPNISIGPMVVSALRKVTEPRKSFLDVHLMIEDPDRYITDFFRAGASRLTVHVEACRHLHRTIQAVKAQGMKAGVALNPATSLITVEEILPWVDLVLIMSVNPGFGGQLYIPESTDKIRRTRAMLTALDSQAWLEVDGGITRQNIGEVVAAGATAIVAGTSAFGGPESIADNLAALRQAGRDGPPPPLPPLPLHMKTY